MESDGILVIWEKKKKLHVEGPVPQGFENTCSFTHIYGLIQLLGLVI